MNKDALSWIQRWYRNHCDGDWEHNENIRISTIDNPGWRVSINLIGTECENREFTIIKIENRESDWYHCFIRNNRFEGACSPERLINVLDVFYEWAKNCENKEDS